MRDAFVSWLPPGTVQLSKHFTSLEQHDNHVVVRFADSSVAARVVVGADGCFSKVRQQTLGDGPPHHEVRLDLGCPGKGAVSILESICVGCVWI